MMALPFMLSNKLGKKAAIKVLSQEHNQVDVYHKKSAVGIKNPSLPTLFLSP